MPRTDLLRHLPLLLVLLLPAPTLNAQRTAKPVLHGRHWVAITGKPLAATAGAAIFHKGGNAVDAACAMLGATSTMYDVLSWGGETQALIYNPNTNKVIGINALGAAPTGATPELFKEKGMPYPPEYGPLAAVTPGTPGGLMVMLAEYGTLRLEDVLEPSIQMAEGYPMEKSTADRIEGDKEHIKEWPYSKAVFLTHLGEEREAPYPGEIFRQPDLAATLRKLVEAEQEALAAGKSRSRCSGIASPHSSQMPYSPCFSLSSASWISLSCFCCRMESLASSSREISPVARSISSPFSMASIFLSTFREANCSNRTAFGSNARRVSVRSGSTFIPCPLLGRRREVLPART